MNRKFYSLVTLLLLASFSLTAQDRYQYSVDLTKTGNDELAVTLLTPKVKAPTILFYMPKIVPGTYTNSNFGKFVHDVKAFDKAGKALPVKQQADSKFLHPYGHQVRQNGQKPINGFL